MGCRARPNAGVTRGCPTCPARPRRGGIRGTSALASYEEQEADSEPPHGRGALIASSPQSASWRAPEQLRWRPERRVAHTTVTCSVAPADAWMRRCGAQASSGERRMVHRATAGPRCDVASGWARAPPRHPIWGSGAVGSGCTRRAVRVH
eukprot:2799256-Prymnesium_polylepis.1